MEIEPLHGDFGARVLEVDLTGPLSAELIAGLHAAIDEHSVLLFGDQSMDDEAHLALTKALGHPEESHVGLRATGDIVHIGTIGNVVDAETKRGDDDPHTRSQKGNNLWHSDSSFRLVPSYVSILHAYEVPDEGGETQFVSQRAAYDRLGPDRQAEIDDLHVLHDYVFSRTKVAPVDDNHAASLPPIEQRLVRTNPTNSRRNYYVGSHARSIIGVERDREPATDRRAQRSGHPARVPLDLPVAARRHGDLDNRCVLHRGLGYDADRYRRFMRQSRVRGAGPTLDE